MPPQRHVRHILGRAPRLAVVGADTLEISGAILAVPDTLGEQRTIPALNHPGIADFIGIRHLVDTKKPAPILPTLLRIVR